MIYVNNAKMIHNWEDIETCKNGKEWKGTIPVIKHRRKLLKGFIEENPMSQMDKAFCLRHYNLLSKKDRVILTDYKTIDDVPYVWRYDGMCKGCWNCCSKSTE